MWMRFAKLYPVYLLLYATVATMSWQIRHDFAPSPESTASFPLRLGVLLFLKSLVFLISREWMRRHRHTSLQDMVHVTMISLASGSLLMALAFATGVTITLSRATIIIDTVLSILAVLGLRTTLRLWSRNEFPLQRRQPSSRTLVFADEKTAAHMIRMLSTTPSNLKVVGIYDPEALHHQFLINGVPVIGHNSTLTQAANSVRATTILLPASTPGRQLREILNESTSAGLEIRMIPLIDELVEGRYKLGPRDITISDLLRREPNQLDMDSICGYVSGQTVMVTGAAGSIGSELCRQLRALAPSKLILLDQSESGIFGIEQEFHRAPLPGVELEYVIADICDEATINQVVGELSPDLIFHAAAYKHVPLMEQHPREAVRNNILGTKTVAEAALAHGVKRFVLISTDKAVRPSSLMGSTKLMAERCIHALSQRGTTEFLAVRFGNVLNSAGSVVPTFLAQIQAGGPITVTHPDMVRYFMTIPEAVQLVLQAGAVGHSGDVLILDMGEPVRIVDLAKDMILLSGMKYPEDIDIVFSGMRPGEKLREELFYELENGSQRIHDKIFRCVPPPTPHVTLMTQIVTLKKLLNAPRDDLRKALVAAVQVWVDDFDQGQQQPKAA